MPNQHKRAPLSIRLPEEEDAWLRAYAATWDISISSAVTRAVRALRDREGRAEQAGVRL